VNVVGIDLSLNATGVALADGTALRYCPPDGPLGARLNRLGVAVLDWCTCGDIVRADRKPTVVVLEDLPVARMARANHGVAMAHGVVRADLHNLAAVGGIAGVAFVQPSQLKRYATGKGNASKAEVLVAAVKRLDYEGADDNEADALWLRAMALDHYGYPVATVPASHREALGKVDWPEIAEVKS
jgi:Holliday junction resolvasome RuvABC endonuclease subunit